MLNSFQGDSGSPLFNDKPEQVGIDSYVFRDDCVGIGGYASIYW